MRRQGCVLAPLLFSMFFAGVPRVAKKLLLADAFIMDNMMQLQRRKDKGDKMGTSRTGKVEEGEVDGGGGGAEVVGYAVR